SRARRSPSATPQRLPHAMRSTRPARFPPAGPTRERTGRRCPWLRMRCAPPWRSDGGHVFRADGYPGRSAFVIVADAHRDGALGNTTVVVVDGFRNDLLGFLDHTLRSASRAAQQLTIPRRCRVELVVESPHPMCANECLVKP